MKDLFEFHKILKEMSPIDEKQQKNFMASSEKKT